MSYDDTLHGAWARRRSPISAPATSPANRPHIKISTAIVPEAIDIAVWEEASDWLGEPLPRAWIKELIQRANPVYARNAHFRKLINRRGNTGRDYLWSFTRHWLAALILKHCPSLHSRLPRSYPPHAD